MAYADGDLPDAKITKEEDVGWITPPKVDGPAAYARIMLGPAFLLAIDGVPMIYYGDEIGMAGAGDPDNRRDMRFGDEVSAPEQEVLVNFEKLTKIRAQHPALRYGSRRSVATEKELLAFVRVQLEDRVLCFFNAGSRPSERELQVGPELSDGKYIDALGGGFATVKEGRMSAKVAPRSAAFFVRSPD